MVTIDLPPLVVPCQPLPLHSKIPLYNRSLFVPIQAGLGVGVGVGVGRGGSVCGVAVEYTEALITDQVRPQQIPGLWPRKRTVVAP